jgi:protein TonB
MFLKLQSDAPKPQPDRTELRVRLIEPPAITIPAASPRLLLPEEPQRDASAVAPSPLRPRREAPALLAAPVAPPPPSPQKISGEAALRVAEQFARELPYPPEAVERGLEGEAMVLLFLDAAGNVIAARLESSSGHAVLDEAALRAARQLRTLPDSAPREALLPVRFRLR